MLFSRRELFRHSAAALTMGKLLRGSPPDPYFTAVPASRSGIVWTHDNARSPQHWLPESMCSGCAFLDYDGDGWMDILLLNSGRADFHPQSSAGHALYKNNRDGTFTDVTKAAGLTSDLWGEGIAVGDYDGDGFPDIFISGYGGARLYRNTGRGGFTDVTKAAGLDITGWFTSAAFFDAHNRGRLDLFVCSFVEYGANSASTCGENQLGRNFYCIPRKFEGRPSLLFRNNGDGTFTEVGRYSAIGKSKGKSHGVVATDVNNDGWIDLFVSNDTVPNFLFLNRGDGKFDEIALQAGVAYGENGQARSGMGVDAADWRNAGLPDLLVANIDREDFSLYRNDGHNRFTDIAAETGIAKASHFLSGWGLKFFDFDNDGNLDLILANGHPDDTVESYSSNVKWAEPLLLFRNDGKSGLVNVSAEAGDAFQRNWPARSLAIGDFDNNGALDVLISNNGGAPLLLRNEIGHRNNWIGLNLRGRQSNPDAVGALVTWSVGGKTRSRFKTAGGSYLSSHDPRMVLGMGKDTKLDYVEIRWPKPSTVVQRLSSLPLNQYSKVAEPV